METRTITLTSVSLYAVAQENRLVSPLGEDLLLTSLSGWDEYSSMDIQTAPKLSGSGSYVLAIRAGEREVETAFSIMSTGDPKPLLLAAQQAMMLKEEVALHRRFFENGAIKRQESLYGFISSVGWDRMTSNAQLSINFLIPTPVKVIQLNGAVDPRGASL